MGRGDESLIAKSRSHDLILQDQASGERSQDQWSSGFWFLLPNV